MRCMGTHGPVLRGSRGISRDALTVKRHRNPLGIFSRALVYPLIGLGAWRHRLDLVASGLVLEALLWTAVPPSRRRLVSSRTLSRWNWTG